MTLEQEGLGLEETRRAHPEKFAPEESIFNNIHRGDRIFIGTGCGEPQYLVGALIRYVESNPKAIFDAEVFQVFQFPNLPRWYPLRSQSDYIQVSRRRGAGRPIPPGFAKQF